VGERVSVLEGLAAVEARDSYTGGHSRRVRRLSLAVGGELGLPENELHALGEAALFHDIGKLGIPEEILLKPTTLTESEWDLMRGHSDEGARMVERIGLAVETVPAIRHHHERFDGAGYPAGLAGEEIPLAARIIHLADAVDSMLTTRVYRPGRPARAALAEVRRTTGSQFCPRCVTALLGLVARGALDELGLPRRALVRSVPAAAGG
jgi:putative nucleotidyltransferase with HDIG domain